MTESTELLESQALEGIVRGLSPAVQEAQAAAIGVRDWEAGTNGGTRLLAGATYEVLRYRLGPEACDTEVERALAKLNPAAQAVDGWTARVWPLASLDAISVANSLRAWPKREPEEQTVKRLSEKLTELAQRSPSLVVLAFEGSGPTMRLAGSALLDNTSREAVFVLGRMTVLTADRRLK